MEKVFNKTEAIKSKTWNSQFANAVPYLSKLDILRYKFNSLEMFDASFV